MAYKRYNARMFSSRRGAASKVDKRSLLKEIPIRFGMILAMEIAFSVVLSLMSAVWPFRSYIQFFNSVGLVGFWQLNWYLAKRNRHHLDNLKQFYVCNTLAFVLFVLAAAVVYIYNQTSLVFTNQSWYFSYFRLSYLIGILDDGTIHVDERAVSMSLFFLATFASIMCEPLFTQLRHARRQRQEAKKRSLGGGTSELDGILQVMQTISEEQDTIKALRQEFDISEDEVRQNAHRVLQAIKNRNSSDGV